MPQEETAVEKVFGDFDITGFWEPSEYALKEYVGRALDDATVHAVEQELGYKLPASYVEFMRFQNGGIPRRKNHRTKERTSWAHDHMAIAGISSVGSEKACSLCASSAASFGLTSGVIRRSACISPTVRRQVTTWFV